ncbi:hypothetical protein [Actinomadura bangladeshensis]|uniref:Uncharacterized protein n=1 Tax=Actinomadura bangladeshensis TaxID=453573 RepID=A0A6L9Q951_9ACTN|nr:hypothetical protein [Actinomadura bangladeshensis]NEA21961.1 hypothetical protein [Actinomadura bangladeshensis]NEA24344.1 hypothetical protein [Actinomadura bangladeshensis]
MLWAHVVGRAEPARIEGFRGITAAEVLDADTRTIAGALSGGDPVVFIRLRSTGGQIPVTESTTFHSL